MECNIRLSIHPLSHHNSPHWHRLLVPSYLLCRRRGANTTHRKLRFSLTLNRVEYCRDHGRTSGVGDNPLSTAPPTRHNSLGLVTNAIVIVGVLANRRMRRSAMNLLLTNQAVTNFLILLHSTVSRAYHMAVGVSLFSSWPFPSWLCTAATYVLTVCWQTNSTMFAVIALERWV